MITRRRFVMAGLGGSVALAVTGRLRAAARASADATAAAPLAALDRDAPAILAAVVPVILAGALPAGGVERENAVAETLRDVAQAIAGLPPSAQQELGELFSLLGFAPARVLLAGVRAPWNEASPESLAAFLERWRTSRFALQRSAYGALHQLTLGAWYTNPRAWPQIGYPGPPPIGR